MPIRCLRPGVGLLDTRIAAPPPKEADPHYQTTEHREWSKRVVARAGRRCEAVDEGTGERCTKAEPEQRMFADHVVELRDGGAALSLDNGRCLCGTHHAIKTAQEKRRRNASAGAAWSGRPRRHGA